MLEQSKRRKPLKNYSAFTFCNILSALVCPHEAPGCTGCQSDHCYLVDQIGVVRKRRALAKLQEDVSELNRPSSFTLVSHDRTAKHYKGARKLLVVDSGASISTTSSIDNLHSVDNWHPNTKVQVANKQFVTVVCTGTMRLTVQDKHGKPLVIISSAFVTRPITPKVRKHSRKDYTSNSRDSLDPKVNRSDGTGTGDRTGSTTRSAVHGVI